MKTLWTPPASDIQVDLNNPFDMAYLLDQQVAKHDGHERKEEGIKAALLLRKTVGVSAIHELTVVTDVGIIDSPIEKDTSKVLDNPVGFTGNFQEFKYVDLGNLAMGLAVKLDALEIFPADEPEQADLIVRPAYALIGKLRFITQDPPDTFNDGFDDIVKNFYSE